MKTMGRKTPKSWIMTVASLMVLSSAVFSPLAAAVLSDDESAALLFLREEEKLARDVYLQLYEQWKLPVFKNIAASEQTHMDAIKTLLDRYGLPDPAAGMAIGQFANPELQALYNELLQDGMVSLVQALGVGVTIEEVDIEDLTAALAITTHKDIQRVFTNLRQASYNHLQSFEKLLAAYTN